VGAHERAEGRPAAREHRRRIHNGADVGPAAWPAIVKDDRHEQVVALLTDPKRRQRTVEAFAEQGAASRKYLLTYGIGSCGVCGAVLRGVNKRIKRKVARARTEDNPEGIVVGVHEMYVCEARGCVGRNRKRVDEFVGAVVVGRLSRADAVDLLRPTSTGTDDTAAEEVRALRRRLDEAAEDYAAGLIDREQMRRITATLRPRLEEAEAAVRTAPGPLPPDLRDLVAAPDVAAVWQAMPLPRQRAVLTSCAPSRCCRRGRAPASTRSPSRSPGRRHERERMEVHPRLLPGRGPSSAGRGWPGPAQRGSKPLPPQSE
jgi:hypothetical protein